MIGGWVRTVPQLRRISPAALFLISLSFKEERAEI